jgi:hypothetical protein
MPRLSRSDLAAIVVALAVVGGTALVLWPRFEALSAPELRDKSLALRGASKEEVVAKLGQPERALSGAEYLQQREGIAASYDPAPPLLSVDEVLYYHEGLRIVLFFIEGRRVVHVYSGLT